MLGKCSVHGLQESATAHCHDSLTNLNMYIGGVQHSGAFRVVLVHTGHWSLTSISCHPRGSYWLLRSQLAVRGTMPQLTKRKPKGGEVPGVGQLFANPACSTLLDSTSCYLQNQDLVPCLPHSWSSCPSSSHKEFRGQAHLSSSLGVCSNLARYSVYSWANLKVRGCFISVAP